MPSGVCVHRPSIQRGEACWQVYPRHLCRGPLEGMSCRHSVCYAGAKCWPSLAEEGFLGWGALGGHPLPAPVPSPVMDPFWAQGSWLVPLEGQRRPSWNFLTLDLVKAWDPMTLFSSSSSRAAESLRKTRWELQAGEVGAERAGTLCFAVARFEQKYHTFGAEFLNMGSRDSVSELNCWEAGVSLLPPCLSLSPAPPLPLPPRPRLCPEPGAPSPSLL